MNLRARWCLAAVFVLWLGTLTWSESVSQLQPTGYVNDFAHVLDPGTTAQINNICLQVDQKAHAQIAVVTINSLDGSDIESFAVDLFKKWGIGSKSTDHGVLILYAIQDHRARIEVGYGLEPILPDGKVGGFQREAIPLMKAGDYNNALLLVTSRVADVIAADAGVQLTGSQPRAPTQGVRRARRWNIPRRDHHICCGRIDHPGDSTPQYRFLASVLTDLWRSRRWWIWWRRWRLWGWRRLRRLWWR